MLRPWIRVCPVSWALLCVGALIALPAHATVVKAMSLEEKCQASPVIVHALVERSEVDWEVIGASVMTLVTVKVVEGLRGDVAPGQTLVLQLGGGQIGDLHVEVPGTNHYEPGEEVVLFLEPLGARYVEIGVGIGKYDVETAGREKWVSFAPKVAAVRLGQGSHAVPEPIPPMEPERLSSFLKRVRSHVAGIPVGVTSPRKTPVHRPVLQKLQQR